MHFKNFGLPLRSIFFEIFVFDFKSVILLSYNTSMQMPQEIVGKIEKGPPYYLRVGSFMSQPIGTHMRNFLYEGGCS